ncbi:hypothetical protein KNV05_gp188 [Vibrio phage River4]|uniref:Uncharacterized protein n=1 Tax=Vibrio phage River4 TaxID=2736288 RepID=A0A6M9Z0Z8_9CAUD|nr:hypothetical protein KNV05_gp188 [Vibrio phage River4]QKN84767.1 hypothetical protein RIVER4_124 [Vibrio phage River4]
MWRRHKVRVNWHRRLKDDEIAKENGFNQRLFKQTEVYEYDLSWRDYPHRTVQRNWKSQSKNRKQWER